MKDFIAEPDRGRLTAHGQAEFDALWARQLTAVDDPNLGRGGVSTVYRLDVDGVGYYLKRQRGHLTRSLRHPLGEPTVAREWRNIQRWQRLGLPTLEVAFFGVRGSGKNTRALLLTRALDGFVDLERLLADWQTRPETQRRAIVHACAQAVRDLHERVCCKHGCLYPRHIFLHDTPDGWQARLIDLEKARPIWIGRRDRVADLDPLLRRTQTWSDAEVRAFLTAYLGDDRDLERWLQPIAARRRKKEARR